MENGAEAIAKLMDSDEKWDVILLGSHLEDMKAYDLLPLIKAMPKPGIYLCAWWHPEIQRINLKNPEWMIFRQYLKTFQKKELLMVIASIMGGQTKKQNQFSEGIPASRRVL